MVGGTDYQEQNGGSFKLSTLCGRLSLMSEESTQDDYRALYKQIYQTENSWYLKYVSIEWETLVCAAPDRVSTLDYPVTV